MENQKGHTKKKVSFGSTINEPNVQIPPNDIPLFVYRNKSFFRPRNNLIYIFQNINMSRMAFHIYSSSILVHCYSSLVQTSKGMTIIHFNNFFRDDQWSAPNLQVWENATSH